jgi:hypothetical protein
VNLTAEKVNAFQVSDPTGHEFGFEYDMLLVPSSLNEVAKNLLTVQDLILDAAATLNGVSNVMGTPTNPHKMSGMSYTRAPDLAGTDTTADWYLLSRAGIAGPVPVGHLRGRGRRPPHVGRVVRLLQGQRDDQGHLAHLPRRDAPLPARDPQGQRHLIAGPPSTNG